MTVQAGDIVASHNFLAPGNLPLRFKDMGDGTYALVLSATANIGDISVTVNKSTTGTITSVASSASNVTLLSSNTNRLGFTLFNDSTANLYVKFGATASTSSFTVKVSAGGYYEGPGDYTGRIDGIWDSANGNARMTELT